MPLPLRRTWQASFAALAVVAACDAPLDPQRGSTPRAGLVDSIVGNVTGSDTLPGTVNDLSVAQMTDSSAIVKFTEVDDGTGRPASYDVREAIAPISWGGAQSVTNATCTTPVGGSAIGATRTCTIVGLTPSRNYQFQLVAFRGTLNQDAVFGNLSNVASGQTLAAATDTTSVPPPSGLWPNEPGSFHLLNNQPWDQMTANGWNYLRRASSKDDDIISDNAAPLSLPDELRIVFTPDMGHDNEPSVHWIGLPGVKEIYTAWWIKLSPNWTASPAGAGKITFLFTNGAGQVYTGFYHQGGDPTNGWVDGPPYRIGVNTEWAPYGQRVWLPNRTTTFINPGEWHRIEVYYRWETTPGASSDGVIRWWVDGVLNGDFTDVHYPAGNFIELQYAPTLQNPPPAEQYMYVDHTYVSVP